MKALIRDQYGSPAVLHVEEIQKPEPRDDQLLVKIAAASVNALDWHILRGEPRFSRLTLGLIRPKAKILGADISGRVEAVGKDIKNFQTGDEVFGCLFSGRLGGFAEYVSPLAAGIRFLPAAGGLMLGAMASEELVRRFGTTRVVAAGLVIMTATMPLALLWEVNTSYLVIGPIVAMCSLGAGLVFAPAAEAVMGAVDAAKAGVGSAMNDVTQMLAGAFSIAVVGSAMYAIYAAKLRDAVASLPAEVAEVVQDSIGAAVQVASPLPQEEALALSAAAKSTFTDALGLAVLIGAGFSLAGVLIVARFMPARDPAVSGKRAQSSEKLGDDSFTYETTAEPVATGTD